MITVNLRQRRFALIREHMDTEVTQEFDATRATFNVPPALRDHGHRPDLNGHDEVMGYYLTTWTAFPVRAARQSPLPRLR